MNRRSNAGRRFPSPHRTALPEILYHKQAAKAGEERQNSICWEPEARVGRVLRNRSGAARILVYWDSPFMG
jgi:hypothetical protein